MRLKQIRLMNWTSTFRALRRKDVRPSWKTVHSTVSASKGLNRDEKKTRRAVTSAASVMPRQCSRPASMWGDDVGRAGIRQDLGMVSQKLTVPKESRKKSCRNKVPFKSTIEGNVNKYL